ncbi:uncharacterized protein A1O5_12598 [Cladophialophora psammophila CBS 110553]|uniref:Major facilitator superfamily (MFS) profile domain-containing protein n=1 Tax=Cladophialophora psammophila CBS 110553 TaxID=1182543 RepID=W9VVU3_9EURO|nr:uncharacterized protein A1O5_12598 [Cladophialophora psammophila CBS 110553]EXJ56331.1 hypothetical protein A1O5_12598 [Cladophialophora psammophila CBS 110553]
MNISVGTQEKDVSPEHIHVEGLDAKEQLKHAGLKEALDAEGGVDKHLEKKLRRKVDRRLLPLCGTLYAVSLIDRLNLPNARLAGMDAALGLSMGSRYSILTMVFFIGYIICDFPANFVMRKVGPASFLGTIGFCWGVLTIGMGFCKTWGELLLCRIIFGMFEGGLFPGLIYLLSCWYVRHEVQVRFSGFYGAGMLVSGLSNLLAYGLSKADGLSGLGGWSWIFIFEGIATCVVAIVVLFFLIDFPDKAARPTKLGFRRFLTPNEAAVILARIERDRGDAIPEKFSLKVVLNHLKDWKIWEYCILLLCNNTVAYAFAYFLPLILHSGMGYSIPMTYTLIFPPYVLAAVWMFIAAYIGDRFMIRGPIIVFNAIWTIVGVVMMGYAKTNSVRYVGVFLGLAPYNASIPAIFSYQHNNIVGQSKRAIGAAVMIAGGGIGGIIASNAFQQKDAPQYRPGLDTVIAVQVLTVVLICKNFFVFTRANRKADRGEIIIEGKEGFRYTL